MLDQHSGVNEIAAAVRRREISAVEVARAALSRIAASDRTLNCFTAITAERALAEAAAVHAALVAGRDPGPLAGVPYAVKNLFDVAGLSTLAGSRINAESPPATADALLVSRLTAAGAILLGALNMDEYAYGFTTENAHYGPTRNPHDPQRSAGGSSGGSAAAVAGGLVPLTLGSDTNGSIRVPASLCGVFGLKPTFGRLSRRGAFPFVASLDHVGPFARSTADLAASYDALQGFDALDPVCAERTFEPCVSQLRLGIVDLRIAIAGDYFESRAEPEALGAVALAAQALGVTRRVSIPEAARARAAAFVITACEGGSLHLPNLRQRAADFDPATRDRLLAGALVPANWYLQAQRFRRWYAEQTTDLFRTTDIILAPATPISAPCIGQTTMMLAGEQVLTRPHLGIFTQPISFMGAPVVAVPIHRPGQMPIGIQVIAAPWREDLCLRVAAALEAVGVASAPVAAP
jgi:AtzE family amidohydrolase